MKMFWIAFSFSLLTATSHAVVFGDDDRIEVMHAQDPRIQKWSTGVAAQFLVESMVQRSADEWAIQQRRHIEAVLSGRNYLLPEEEAKSGLIKDYPACASLPFQSQPHSANCTSFLISEQVLMTAGHCVTASEMKDYLWVFDYRFQESEQETLERVESTRVYRAQAVISSRERRSKDGSDWAIVFLDRPTQGRHIFELEHQRKIPITTRLGTIGFPSGLPMKVASRGAIIPQPEDRTYVDAQGKPEDGTEHSVYFEVDASGGNSGGPVIELATGKVAGILVAVATGIFDFWVTPQGCVDEIRMPSFGATQLTEIQNAVCTRFECGRFIAATSMFHRKSADELKVLLIQKSVQSN
jgi:V8-like Glu-specific endopeptidase